jgi:hypothetical protein
MQRTSLESEKKLLAGNGARRGRIGLNKARKFKNKKLETTTCNVFSFPSAAEMLKPSRSSGKLTIVFRA